MKNLKIYAQNLRSPVTFFNYSDAQLYPRTKLQLDILIKKLVIKSPFHKKSFESILFLS